VTSLYGRPWDFLKEGANSEGERAYLSNVYLWNINTYCVLAAGSRTFPLRLLPNLEIDEKNVA